MAETIIEPRCFLDEFMMATESPEYVNSVQARIVEEGFRYYAERIQAALSIFREGDIGLVIATLRAMASAMENSDPRVNGVAAMFEDIITNMFKVEAHHLSAEEVPE